jgi:hypothetical protein
MKIRLMNYDDMDDLRNIWNKYYSEDFPFPLNSLRKQLEKYIITDDNNNNNNILLFGMIELYPEINCISNLDADIIDRRKAYHLLLNKLESDCLHYNMKELYCSVAGDGWIRHVRKMGFTDLNKKMLVKRL